MRQRIRLPVRWLGEFLVIVIGVLAALAADRWNVSRSERVLEAQFLDRMISEIRQDSSLARDYIAQTELIVSSRDSLLSYVGGGPPPPVLIPTILNARMPLDLPVPAAWSEMQSTSSLNILRDPTARRVLTRYYSVERPRVIERFEQAARYAEDPFFDALYRIGWGTRGPDGNLLSTDTVAFRRWPDMTQLLNAVGSAHAVRVTFAGLLADVSSTALRELESVPPR